MKLRDHIITAVKELSDEGKYAFRADIISKINAITGNAHTIQTIDSSLYYMWAKSGSLNCYSTSRGNGYKINNEYAKSYKTRDQLQKLIYEVLKNSHIQLDSRRIFDLVFIQDQTVTKAEIDSQLQIMCRTEEIVKNKTPMTDGYDCASKFVYRVNTYEAAAKEKELKILELKRVIAQYGLTPSDLFGKAA